MALPLTLELVYPTFVNAPQSPNRNLHLVYYLLQLPTFLPNGGDLSPVIKVLQYKFLLPQQDIQLKAQPHNPYSSEFPNCEFWT